MGLRNRPYPQLEVREQQRRHCIVVLSLRAIGDTKVAGFTKTVRDTAFSRADDQYFTPLITFIALGATAALL